MIFGSILKKIPIKEKKTVEFMQRIKSVNEGHEIIVPDFEILDVKNNEIHVKQDYIRGNTINSYKCFTKWHIHQLVFLDCVLEYDDFGPIDFGWNNFILGENGILYYVDLQAFKPSTIEKRAIKFQEKYIDREYDSCLRQWHPLLCRYKVHMANLEKLKTWCGKEYIK